jgi:2-hydroxy-6-oxonona-2,4-dienedioate hydrolase
MTEGELTANGTSRFVTTKLHKLHYHEAGQGHPVVMLHGGGPGASGWSNFSPNIGPLSREFRVLAFDLPGWGETQDLDPETPPDHVQALILALDALQIERVTLIGNSMGGMTGIRLAVEHPDRISHLIPMGANCPGVSVFSPGGAPSEGMKILFETSMDPSPANFKRLVSIMAYDQSFATDELAKERSENVLAHPEHAGYAARLMPTMASFFALSDRLSEITAPTLIIHGRDDRTVPFENALRLLAAVPDSRLVLFNRCGHWAQLEHAAEFNRLVAQFVLAH